VIPVNRSSITNWIAGLALAVVATITRADAVPFAFDRAIYADEKEVAFSVPEGVACNDAGDVVVADTGNGRLVTFRYTGGALTGGKPVKVAGLVYPVRIQFDSKGNLLVLDRKSRKILRVDRQGALLGTLEIKGGASILNALPVAFKLDGADNVHVIDGVGRRLLVLDPAGAVTRQVDLPKGQGFTDVHVDLAGTIYVVDGSDAVVWALEKGAQAFKALTPSMKDRMSFPVYITGSRGKLFLVDQFGNGIVVLGQDGAFQGRQLAIGWGEGLLYYPAQLCLNAQGEAFVADRSNNRVQIFNTAK
jgi:DNA-binding beta-propeller fold protein YncE